MGAKVENGEGGVEKRFEEKRKGRNVIVFEEGRVRATQSDADSSTPCLAHSVELSGKSQNPDRLFTISESYTLFQVTTQSPHVYTWPHTFLKKKYKNQPI